ncbi:MAG: 30S ribosomal protein S3, partial [Halopseudomonas aestusnigri]|nr:30S ribosomal protein S3 [Halopseudomonas aestusnigri]
HTLRADIDFARATAKTSHGSVGVKVWIFKGEVIGGRHEELKPQAPAPRKKAAK